MPSLWSCLVRLEQEKHLLLANVFVFWYNWTNLTEFCYVLILIGQQTSTWNGCITVEYLQLGL